MTTKLAVWTLNSRPRFASAFDSPDDLRDMPPGYGIWTNKIEIMGPAWLGRD